MKKILVCTDGSRYSEVCCEYACWLAQRTEAVINVLYLTDIRQFEVPLVADLSGSLGIQPYQDVITQLQEMERQKSLYIRDITDKVFTDAGLTHRHTFHHRTGLLVDCLDDFEKDVDIVLLGKRGENADFATEHLGSTMERVIRAIKKPCLVTSRSFQEIKKVIIAYDGGASCRKAISYIAGTEEFKDLELNLVTVSEDKSKDCAQNSLIEAEAILTAQGYAPKCHLLEGEAEKAISHFVEENDMNLLVMGAYGHSRIRYLLIGSTTTEMIRSCKIPILCFR